MSVLYVLLYVCGAVMQAEAASFTYTASARGWRTGAEAQGAERAEHTTAPDARMTAQVRGPDPGYFATSISFVQCALRFLLERDRVHSYILLSFCISFRCLLL